MGSDNISGEGREQRGASLRQMHASPSQQPIAGHMQNTIDHFRAAWMENVECAIALSHVCGCELLHGKASAEDQTAAPQLDLMHYNQLFDIPLTAVCGQ